LIYDLDLHIETPADKIEQSVKLADFDFYAYGYCFLVCSVLASAPIDASDVRVAFLYGFVFA